MCGSKPPDDSGVATQVLHDVACRDPLSVFGGLVDLPMLDTRRYGRELLSMIRDVTHEPCQAGWWYVDSIPDPRSLRPGAVHARRREPAARGRRSERTQADRRRAAP
ncbi:MAG: hypothetical protein AB1651_16715 [Pseudomonadota bacterium]|jgi:hypothetical protein